MTKRTGFLRLEEIPLKKVGLSIRAYGKKKSHCLPGELEGVANRPECLDESLKYTVSGETRQI